MSRYIHIVLLLFIMVFYGCGPGPDGPDTPPTISLSSPQNAQIVGVNHNFSITGSASDDTSVQAVYMLVNGGTQTKIGSGSAFNYTFSLNTPGVFDLSFFAVDNANNSSEVVHIVVQATNGTETAYSSGSLLINEVGSTYFAGVSSWFEIYNTTAGPIDLSDFLVASTYITSSSPYYIYFSRTYFALPATNIPAGGYMLIRGFDYKGDSDGPGVVHIGNENYLPFWTDQGFIELLSLGQTVDFVRFGGLNVNPLTGSFSSSAPALPNNSNDYGKSIARSSSSSDTDSGTDWLVRAFSTAGGINDITNDTDIDQDGVPDQAEVPGGTFAGLPLYDWGARTNQRDIFLHIDYMDSLDPGVIPRQEALELVRSVFSNENFSIHIDIGNKFSGALNPSLFNLDNQDHKVPASPGIALGEVSGRANLYAYKSQYMDIRKKQIFHYCVFAISQQPYATNQSSGIAELDGNDLIVTLGNWNLNTAPVSKLNELIHWQAATLMHEFGHNLGLHHGGDGDENYKPNYYSIMNYAYQLYGLPVIGAPAEGDRYYLYKERISYSQLTNGPATAQFNMNYSHGSGGSLYEGSLNESWGLRQAGSAGVDWNGDNDTLDSGFSYDLNGNTFLTSLNDYNDWGNLHLFFFRYWQGDNNGATLLSLPRQPVIWQDPMSTDRQEIITETLTAPHRD